MRSIDKVVWDDGYVIGLPNLDGEHQSLFGAVNALLDSVNRGSCIRTLQTMLESIRDFAASHFRHEEALMQENGYYAYQHHKSCHDHFLAVVAEFHRQCILGDEIAWEIGFFLQNWFTAHVGSIDMELGDFLKSHLKLGTTIDA